MWRLLTKWRIRFQEWSLNNLLLQTGIDLSPEEGVFGILSKGEEENVLARLYNDKEWVALMRKYAEGANHAMTTAVRTERQTQALRFNAQFYTYSSIILKARRAALKLKEHADNQAPV